MIYLFVLDDSLTSFKDSPRGYFVPEETFESSFKTYID